MNGETVLRLALVPAAVWLASLAARRWGHKVSGYLGGMPLIGGPITLFLALDHGEEFAARSALFTLAAIAAQATHLMLLGHVGRRTGSWIAALLAGWCGFAVMALAVVQVPLSPAIGLVLALAGLAAAWRWLPRYRGLASLPGIPPLELRLRLAAAFLLAGFILWSAPIFGPVVSGVLLSLPITGSIMPPFTLALYGADALARLLRGFVVGLSGFAAFFFVVASATPAWGIAGAFTAAVASAMAAAFVVDHLARRGSSRS
ncbi:MAG TPA: hypothetical protein VM122_08190 [Usitatibacter sp.]|nr:hypothetical protein [Usitatibacter sp.]